MSRPFPLYHWSPRSRRASILRRGLVVGSRHAVHSNGWRATYLCYSNSPSFGWAYSGDTLKPDEPQEWDLWMTWSTAIPDRKKRDDHKGQLSAEYRSKLNVPKRKLWYVGTRVQKARKRK